MHYGKSFKVWRYLWSGPVMSPYWNTFRAVIAIIPVQPRREGRNVVKMVNL